VQPVADPHERAGAEALQVEGVVVEDAGGLGVAGVVHLEAAVEQHPVHDVGADPAADGVARLEDRRRDPGVLSRRAQARPARPAPTTTTSAVPRRAPRPEL
jgi:hypothetical protein